MLRNNEFIRQAYIIEFSKTYKREFAEYLEVIRLHQMASREMIVEKQDFCRFLTRC